MLKAESLENETQSNYFVCSDRPVPVYINQPVPYPVVKTVTVDRPVPQYIPQPYPVVKHVPFEVRVPV